MKIEIKVPSVGESVNEAILAQWYKSDGAAVSKDEPLFAIETDKVTLEVVAEASGLLNITVQEGETVDIGAVVGTIDTEAAVSDTPTEETPGEVSEAANHITEPPQHCLPRTEGGEARAPQAVEY